MLMDMSMGIEFELRDTLGDGPLYKVALRILRRALAYGALSQTPDWFNDDDNFSQVRRWLAELSSARSEGRIHSA